MLGTESGGSEEEKEGRIEVGRERESRKYPLICVLLILFTRNKC